MSFKYKELFVLFAIFEAINGLALENISNGKSPSTNLPTTEVTTGKFLNVNTSTAESVTVIVPSPYDIISNSTESPSDKNNTTKITTTTKTTTSTTTTTTTTVTTSAPPTPPTTMVPPIPWKEGRWVIRNNTYNTTCIIAEMAMQLNITYPGKDRGVKNAILNVPDNATGSGSCMDNAQSLNISWGPGHSLLINFGVNETAKDYFISSVSLNVNATVLKDASDEPQILCFKNNSIEFAPAPLEMSYKCNKTQNLKLKGQDANTNAVLHLKNAQYEAYMNNTKAEFGAAQDCDAFETPDIVPIAVGCALAILVLVVLVAYLIARKRSHNQGYFSM